MSKAEILERRSVNSFDSSKELSEDRLREVIDLAVNAPSAFNLEPWRVIAVRSEEGKEKLFNLALQQPKVKEAPVSLIIIGDRSGYDADNPAWGELEAMVGAEYTEQAKGMAANLYGTTEERKIKFAESNAGLLGMSIMHAAAIYGVDTHPMSGIDFDGLKEAFNLKESEAVVMVIAIGFRDESQDLYPRRSRKTFDSLVELV